MSKSVLYVVRVSYTLFDPVAAPAPEKPGFPEMQDGKGQRCAAYRQSQNNPKNPRQLPLAIMQSCSLWFNYNTAEVHKHSYTPYIRYTVSPAFKFESGLQYCPNGVGCGAWAYCDAWAMPVTALGTPAHFRYVHAESRYLACRGPSCPRSWKLVSKSALHTL